MSLKVLAPRVLHGSLVSPRRVIKLGMHLASILPSGSILDVGCGDGSIDALILERRTDISIQGVDVLLRPQSRIPVQKFDGSSLPFDDKSFDSVLFVDVLHHTDDPSVLLKEAARVARKNVVLKDHTMDGLLSRQTLRFMDWFGNAHHGVVLPYNYWPEQKWQDEFVSRRLPVEKWISRLGLYPWPFSMMFDRRLHFIAVLSVSQTNAA